MESPRTLRTQRLILRPWCEADLEPFAVLNADPRVMEFFPSCYTRAESDALAGRVMEYFAKHGYGLWAVELPGGCPFLGFVGLSTPRFEASFTPCVEIGWRLALDHWGKGYAREAAHASIDFGFDTLKLDGIVSFTSQLNLRSQRVMQAIGMTHSPDEDFNHPFLADSHRLQRHVLYRLSRAEWEKMRKI